MKESSPASMDIGRRSLGSSTVSKERRKKSKPVHHAAFLSFDGRDVHPLCPSASNPYHKCYQYCLDKIPSGKNGYFDAVRTERKDKKLTKMAERKGMDSNCPYGSNPYHKCYEYCFEKTSGRVQDMGREQEQNRELKKVLKKGLIPVSFNAIYSFHKHAGNFFCINPVGHPERIKGIPDITDRSSVHPNCKYASNPYHRCAEYCFEDIPEKNQNDVGTKPDEFQESLAEKGRNILVNEKIHVESHCTEALNPGNNVGPYDEIILQEDTKKSSMNFKFEETSTPDYNHAEFSKEITFFDGNNDLISVANEVEMTRPKRQSDVQPLHIDAYDFFIEWTKYCSQEMADEYKIVMQDKTEEGTIFSANNGEGSTNLKYYDSSTFHKAKAEGRLQLFLPTSLLFLVGFVFSLFYWTRMFLSVISERKNRSEGVVDRKEKQIVIHTSQ